MKILILSLIAAGAILPTFSSADLQSLVGDSCLVPIYHTQFAFPPEGGQVVRFPNGQMYFVRTYLAGCEGAGAGGTVIQTGGSSAVVTPTPVSTGIGSGQTTLQSLVGEPCLVPVYHTEFAFPPEGGYVIRYPDGRMFFVRNYLPGCANAGVGGTTIATASSNTSPVSAFPQQTSAVATPYLAPTTGCKN